MIKTYVFGLLAPDNPALVATHLAERARAWNRLAELHDTCHRAFLHELGEQHPGVRVAQDEYDATRRALAEHRQMDHADNPDARDIEAALKRKIQQQYTTIINALKPLKDEVRDLTHSFNARFLKEGNQLTGSSFLWWPNRNILMQEAIRARQQALRRGGRLRYRTDPETGTLAIPFPSPIPAAHLTGQCPNLEIRGEGRKRTLRFTVSTQGKKRDDKIVATFPMVMHRPLPADAMIKLARLVVSRIGASLKYEIHFVVETGLQLVAHPRPLTAAINMGWRITETGLRVAALKFSDDTTEALELPADWMLSFDYMEDLQLAVRKTAATDWPLILPELDMAPPGVQLLVDRLRARPATALGLRTLGREWAREAPLPPHLRSWYDANWRSFDEAARLRKRLLARRQAIYRNFVAQLAQRVRAIAIEQIDLATLSSRQKDDDSWLAGQRKAHRQRAALSTLRLFLLEASRAGLFTVDELKAPHLTQECHQCGTRNVVGSPLMVTCSGCSAQWDQDYNNASNLLRALSNHIKTTKR